MTDVPEFLWSPEPITFGRGRILYAPNSVGCDGIHRQEGWVIPGGERTTNRERAFAVAVEIDRIITETRQ